MSGTISTQDNLFAQAVIFNEVCYAISVIEDVKNMNSLRSKRLFTTTEYYKLLEIGVLKESDRVELIDGEIIIMPPIGLRHFASVKRLNSFLSKKSFSVAIIGVVNPIHLNHYSELQPDISIIKFRDDYYASGHPEPEDTLIAIEVADSSVDYDRQVKIPKYAEAGIPEAWLVDLINDRIEIYALPTEGIYQEIRIVLRHQKIISRTLPQLELNAEDILG